MLHLVELTAILLRVVFQYELENELEIALPMHEKDKKRAQRMAEISLAFINNTEEEPEVYGHSLYKEYKRYTFLYYRTFDKKIRYFFLHFAPTEQDFVRTKVRDQFFILYYPLRILSIIKRSGKHVLDNLITKKDE